MKRIAAGREHTFFGRQARKTSLSHNIRSTIFDSNNKPNIERNNSFSVDFRSVVDVVLPGEAMPSKAFVLRPIVLATDQRSRSDPKSVAVAVGIGVAAETDLLRNRRPCPRRQKKNKRQQKDVAAAQSWCQYRLRARAVLSSSRKIPRTVRSLLRHPLQS